MSTKLEIIAIKRQMWNVNMDSLRRRLEQLRRTGQVTFLMMAIVLRYLSWWYHTYITWIFQTGDVKTSIPKMLVGQTPRFCHTMVPPVVVYASYGIISWSRGRTWLSGVWCWPTSKDIHHCQECGAAQGSLWVSSTRKLWRCWAGEQVDKHPHQDNHLHNLSSPHHHYHLCAMATCQARNPLQILTIILSNNIDSSHWSIQRVSSILHKRGWRWNGDSEREACASRDGRSGHHGGDLEVLESWQHGGDVEVLESRHHGGDVEVGFGDEGKIHNLESRHHGGDIEDGVDDDERMENTKKNSSGSRSGEKKSTTWPFFSRTSRGGWGGCG